ncbi:MAG: outer membrane protein assembly factor BamE [Gallionella sp.]|nr:outer membrane protein assembly factor BamE [Gallionella sp.]
MRIKTFLLPFIMFLPLLSSCATYKMDIRQGNYVTAEMRDKLKLGMTKQQVRYVMGTPMISDPFHESRWDYVYSLEQTGKVVEQQSMTLYFEGDSLARVVDGERSVEVAPAKENK